MSWMPLFTAMIVLLMVSTPLAYADLTVSIPHTHYETDDTLVISGIGDPTLGEEIKLSGIPGSVFESAPVTIQIFYANNLIEIVQISLAKDGAFTHTVKLAGSLWETPGLYTVRVSHGTEATAETHFWFNYAEGGALPNSQEEVEVKGASSNSPKIVMTTDKQKYDSSDVVSEIRGKVEPVGDSRAVPIDFVDPDGNYFLSAEITIENDGSFDVEMPVDSIFSESGTYRIEVRYDYFGKEVKETASIQFIDTLNAPTAKSQPTPSTSQPTASKDIPEWVREIFVFWANGEISDDDLKEALKFLINSQIIEL